MAPLAQEYVRLADKNGVDLFGVALQGIEHSQDRFDSVSSQFASPSALSGGTVDTANLSQAATALLSAKGDFESNLELMKTADEMQQTAIDLLA